MNILYSLESDLTTRAYSLWSETYTGPGKWNVVATDMYGSESSSDSLYFYTDSFPEPPAHFFTINPEDGSEGLPTSISSIKTLAPIKGFFV